MGRGYRSIRSSWFCSLVVLEYATTLCDSRIACLARSYTRPNLLQRSPRGTQHPRQCIPCMHHLLWIVVPTEKASHPSHAKKNAAFEAGEPSTGVFSISNKRQFSRNPGNCVTTNNSLGQARMRSHMLIISITHRVHMYIRIYEILRRMHPWDPIKRGWITQLSLPKKFAVW